MGISVIIVSFKSFHIIEKIVQSIEENTDVLVIENSLDKNLKEKIEKLYKNVKVIIPDQNLGFSGAINLGIKKSKNNFVFCMPADVVINKECFSKISDLTKHFHDFAMIAPSFLNETTYKNYRIFKKNYADLQNKIVSSYNLIDVDEIDGSAFLINKKKFSDLNIMDENFFLYYESNDLCLRLKKNKEKLYVIENLKFDHIGRKSSHDTYNHEVDKCRHWHYCWSKFYFFYKHYGYFFGVRKTIPNLFKAIKSCVYCKFKSQRQRYELHKSELSGLLNAYLLKSSFYRPIIE